MRQGLVHAEAAQQEFFVVIWNVNVDDARGNAMPRCALWGVLK